MNTGLKKSIDRAINLMDTPADYENYISIKINPVSRECCCFHCWPNTWAVINKYISPRGQIEDEGDVLIKQNNESFVLECHESGPEIICLINAFNTLIKPIVDLIVTLLKARQNEPRRPFRKVKIIRRRYIKGQAEEEEIIEIDGVISSNIIKKIDNNIRNVIEGKNIPDRKFPE